MVGIAGLRGSGRDWGGGEVNEGGLEREASNLGF